MNKVKVGVAGYGVIGNRLAAGVIAQEDMELVGVADVAPTLAVRALKERGMPFPLFAAVPGSEATLGGAGIPVSGSFDDLLGEVDIMLDSAPGGIGAKNKEKYLEHGVKAVFQGGEAGEVADVFFHGTVNYEQGLGVDYLKLTSCNTTGLIRSVDAIHRAVGVAKTFITIVRRVADPGDTHRGLTNVLQVEPVPNHQAVDLMHIMPDIEATGMLIHTPVTHGHIITLSVTPRQRMSVDAAIDAFRSYPRIKVVRIEDGFNSNSSLFQWARYMEYPRADMFEIGLWEEMVGLSGDDIVFAINIPQEAVTIPETIDAIRAAMQMNLTGSEAVATTDKYLGI
ncbi:MAG: type II glyceraldehyde-3-phosphate dehydrogenase [Ilumatobacter sp.]|uniref:type II glyceraldehyde-3-phosphate dehydrogenase n=1 Tax=Ilumatobacter sp. TaxID=1967498 RepID=UPI0026371DF1|nr:type II glyceraldehyde-3-phosphate dehydrogenase [Ilumatobacter sp.]MDJ0771539.1 type II glyceraldehyde-3-phosphate dehydrogenase [Ilumatobacter sp.]